MNRKTLIPAGVAAGIVVLLGVLIAFGLFPKVTAQEGVVEFLIERFKELNIPVTEITILTEFPLHLQVVVQRTSESATFDEFLTLHAVEREVFITARQHGYAVDRLAKILVDSQGKQLYYEDTGFNAELMTIDASPSILSNEETKELVNDLLVDKYQFHGNLIANLDITSSDGLQTLDIQLTVSSPEEVDKVVYFVSGMSILAEDVNAQGAQIVMITLEAKDETGHGFLIYMYDVQLRSATWFQDDNLIDLSAGHPLAPPSTHTPQPTVSPTATP